MAVPWAPDYATGDDLEEYARIHDDVDAAQFALAVTAASRVVDTFTGRQFGSATGERVYDEVRYDYEKCRYFIDIDDVMVTPTTVEFDGTVVTDYRLEPRNATADGRPYTRLSSEMRFCEASIIADPWGWSAIPDTITQATLLQGSRIIMRRQAPFGVAGSPQTGSEVRLLARVDPDVAVLLAAYRRATSPH